MTTFSTASRSSDGFEDFYAEWYPRAVSAARRRGLRDPEAVANEIMLMFFEKDYLQRHDPTMEGAVGFDSWVQAMLYNRLANAYRDEKRRPLMVEETDVAGAEVEGPSDFKMLALGCFQVLRDRYGSALAATWVSVVKQVVEDTTADTGKIRRYLIADHLGVPGWEASSLLDQLRTVILSDDELREMLNVSDRTRNRARISA